jgi:carbamoyl-phosphate synthase/aspartate carbamoyltransferase/dihydroorotase
MQGLPITCEVAPHHLFLNQGDGKRLGPLGDMRPLLGSQDDVDALWSHIDETVDCIATDHAPHTLGEKHSDSPPPGIPGLQTSLPLMLTAVEQERLSLDRLVALMHDNPRRIFGLPEQEDTHIEVELRPSRIRNEDSYSKVGWTPFDGVEVVGQVSKVVLRGEVVYEDGRVLAAAGHGRLLPV